MNISNLNKLTAAVVFLAVAGVAQADFTTNTTFTSVNAVIPEGAPTGMTSQTNLSGITGPITDVTVTLDITGGFNGDLYAYLAGPAGGFAVLLNRAGVTGSDAFGYSDPGFNVTFDDASPNNIHYYQLDDPGFNPSSQLTGTWAPDGRNIDPQSAGSAFDSASPTADLSSFGGNSANGAWTLFVADLSSGAPATLVNWGMTVVTAPEPGTCALVAGGAALLLALHRRRKL